MDSVMLGLLLGPCLGSLKPWTLSWPSVGLRPGLLILRFILWLDLWNGLWLGLWLGFLIGLLILCVILWLGI